MMKPSFSQTASDRRAATFSRESVYKLYKSKHSSLYDDELNLITQRTILNYVNIVMTYRCVYMIPLANSLV